MRVDFASCELKFASCEFQFASQNLRVQKCELRVSHICEFLNIKVECINFDQIITSYKQFLLGKYNACRGAGNDCLN